MNALIQNVRNLGSELFSATPVQFAYLYGSVAKDIVSPFSDLDVAIYVEGLDRKESLDLELSLSLNLDTLLNNIIESEVRIINYLPLTVQGDIVTTGILIYCQNDAKRVDFETNLRMVYFDFMPVIRRYQHVYFVGLKIDLTSPTHIILCKYGGQEAWAMVSIEKIAGKILRLDEFLTLLRQISATPPEKFLKDKILIGSAKYYLQVSIECCLDIANHIISAEHFRAPKDYADSFKVIEENKIISLDLGKKLQQMAKFRNRLVHLYGEIDDAYVFDFITEDVNAIHIYRTIVINRYLRRLDGK